MPANEFYQKQQNSDQLDFSPIKYIFISLTILTSIFAYIMPSLPNGPHQLIIMLAYIPMRLMADFVGLKLSNNSHLFIIYLFILLIGISLNYLFLRSIKSKFKLAISTTFATVISFLTVFFTYVLTHPVSFRIF